MKNYFNSLCLFILFAGMCSTQLAAKEKTGCLFNGSIGSIYVYQNISGGENPYPFIREVKRFEHYRDIPEEYFPIIIANGAPPLDHQSYCEGPVNCPVIEKPSCWDIGWYLGGLTKTSLICGTCQ